ncbi:hypothetical protein B0O80DRAFT_421431 [Mortierella sp. GBAus27b]|nr:hypothetical protein B0O80DRAFT_421431 [Mortierella sp. GBAus27b]
MAACSRALSIPEVLGLLSPYLSPDDLYVCVQVNSEWNRFFIPKLWHTINDWYPSWRKVLTADHEDENRLQEVFAKYGHHIRRLFIHKAILIDVAAASGACTNLQELDIDFQVPYGEGEYWMEGHSGTSCKPLSLEETPHHTELLKALQNQDLFEPPKDPFGEYICTSLAEEETDEGWVFTQNYWTLVLTNPNLQRLRLVGKAGFQWSPLSYEFFYESLSRMKRLKELYASESVLLADLWRLREVAPNVESVTVADDTQAFRQNELLISGGNIVLPEHNSTIKTLRLDPSSWILGPKLLDMLAILLLLPNLEDLFLASAYYIQEVWLPSPSSILEIPDQGFKLLTLHAYNSTSLAPLLRYLPNLKELVASILSDEDFGTMAIHCRRLEFVEVRRSRESSNDAPRMRIQYDGIHRFLLSCPTLKVFDGVELCLKAEDIVREPWACREIESLRCRIVGVDRLTDDEQKVYDKVVEANPGLMDNTEEAILGLVDVEQAVVRKLKQSQEQQKQVYGALGKLAQLKLLYLRLAYDCPETYLSEDGEIKSMALDTLEFSLDSGLDRLGGFVESREVSPVHPVNALRGTTDKCRDKGQQKYQLTITPV